MNTEHIFFKTAVALVMAATAALGGPSASAETYRNVHGSLPESATPAAVADTTIFDTLDEVVVTGSNNAVSRNLLPYTVSTVSSSKIAASGQTKLLTAISGQVPGLFISQRSNFGFGISTGGSGGIKIRGVGGSPTNAVLMMVDGQPQFAGIYSHHVADFYEAEYVERVEVLRGPASVLYGSNAMGGVINVITRNADRQGFHASLTSQYGSYNTWQSSLSATARYGRFSALVSASHGRSDGTVENFDFRQGSVYAKLGYEFSDSWKLQADYTLMKFVGNDPIYAKIENPESTDIYHQDIVRGEGSLALSNSYDRTNGTVRVYYSYGNHFIADPDYFHSLDDRFGVLAYQNVDLWKGAAATFGFDFNRYTGEIPFSGGNAHHEGSMSTIDRKSITEYSPYVTLAQEFLKGGLVLNAGLRMANSDMFGTRWIPQFGITGNPGSGWTLKASAAEGYRNPSFRELYLYMPANPELEPESMVNYEVTVGKSFAQLLNISLTGYHSHGSNLIQTAPGPTGQPLNQNTGSFTNKGIEVTANSAPMDNLSLQASYSYLHTTLTDLTGAPKHQYYLGVNWQALPELRVDASLQGVAGLYVHESMPHENYALLNLRLSYDLLDWMKLFINMENLTDTRYTIIYGYEMPGITATGGFRVHF